MSEPRAKPLNTNTLAALPVGVRIWDDQIAYLVDIIRNEDFKTRPATFRERVQHDHDALVRAREWLQSIITTRGA
jgi:hypothetical protein